MLFMIDGIYYTFTQRVGGVVISLDNVCAEVGMLNLNTSIGDPGPCLFWPWAVFSHQL